MNDLDFDFIRHAERVTSFNITANVFTSLKHKKEIQHLFNKHFFPKFDIEKAIQNVDQRQLNALIAELKRMDNHMFSKMHNYNLKGVGPGEVTLYFLVNQAHLGGGSSAGVDLVDGTKKYEVKAVSVSKDNKASNFKLGGTVPLSDIMQDLNDIRETLKLGGTKTEMSGKIVDEMRRRAGDAFRNIEDRYADVGAKYFAGHNVIFMNNGGMQTLGQIEAIKQVKKSDITIERVTSGTVKPRVQL